MYHFQIAIYIISLISGAFVLHLLYTGYKAFSLLYLKTYIYHIACISLLVLSLLIGDYFKINLYGTIETGSSSIGDFFLINRGILIKAVIITALIGFGLTYIKMILLIQGKVPGRMMRTGLFIFPAGLLIVYMAGLINFLYTDSRSLLVFADSAVPYSIIIVMLAFIIAKYFDVRKSGEADNANILKTLLLFYFLSILFMTLNDAFFSRFYMLIRGSIFLLMIIFPVLWLRSSYFRSIRNIFPASGEVDFELFGSTYNLSEREKDVFKLILQGHSNKEIQDKLCIALHTVKNHNYNIYKKLGIRSRGELFKLVLDWTNQQ